VTYARAIPNYRYPPAPNVGEVARLRAAASVTIPVIGTGKIASVGVAEAVLDSGACDMVAMTRAHIADPDVVSKAASGAADRIRPCVGANVCVNRKLAGYAEISCLHNPEVLRERELRVTPAAVRRRVLVVGAGPAGLKAAEVAARRGHDVAIFDPHPAGGRLRHTTSTAASAMVGSVEHLVAELAELGIKVTQEAVTEAVLRTRSPDEVVVATGGRPDPGAAFPGAAEAGALDSADALVADLGFAVVVYDTVGANEGALVAEAIAGKGHRVTFVTPYEVAMPQGGQLHRFELPTTLFGRVDRVLTRALVGVAAGGVATVVTPEGDTIDELAFDSIVTVTPTVPELGLVPVLERLGIRYRVVGDAVSPRLAAQAFKDGHEAGLAL
jgi:NADPH-dependent 2,4-dienoyl-CoA reductase/sulfur reductase-like enzyme